MEMYQNNQDFGYNQPNFQPVGPEKSPKKRNNSGKTFFLSFLGGAAGACLVVGICFGIPGIRTALVGQQGSIILSNKNNNFNPENVNTYQVSLSSFSDTGVSVAQKVLPSVVGIKVTYPVRSYWSGNSSTGEAAGSGVIISKDGYILTNNHVISASPSESSYYSIGEATEITVKLYNDETTYPATVVGSDAKTDLAVLKIDKNDLTAAELGDSDSVLVGEWCMAIGNPLGMESSVSAGLVSALNREVTDEDGKKYHVIQTDAAINSGNSGGALVNSKGQVIGINTIKVSGSGIEGLGFAIPINETVSVTNDLIKYNKVIRPYMGVACVSITDEVIKANPRANLTKGVYIRTVASFSPAEKAGLQAGDIMIAIDDQPILTYDEMTAIKDTHKVGDTITIKFIRNGSTKTTQLTLAEE
jgi:serine protease Do